MTKMNTKQGLRMNFYENLLDRITTKNIDKAVIVNGKHCLVVDQKYEKVTKFLLNRYEKLEDEMAKSKKNYHKNYYTYLLIVMIIIMFLLKLVKVLLKVNVKSFKKKFL